MFIILFYLGINILISCSGLLTDKFKRGAQLAATDTRVGWLASFPNPFFQWDQYKDNDRYYHLIDVLSGIAKKNSEYPPLRSYEMLSVLAYVLYTNPQSSLLNILSGYEKVFSHIIHASRTHITESYTNELESAVIEAHTGNITALIL